MAKKIFLGVFALILAATVGSWVIISTDASLQCLKGDLQEKWEESVEACRKSANEGNAESQEILAYMYRNGKGVTKDLSAAQRYLDLARRNGNVKATAYLGTLYLDEGFSGYNIEKGMQLLIEAASQCHLEAIPIVAIYYLKEGNPFGFDRAESLKWLVVGRLMARQYEEQEIFATAIKTQENKATKEQIAEANRRALELHQAMGKKVCP
jgi:hypothetical protein